MVEILGNNLKKFFDTIDNSLNDVEITYAGSRYEVWEVTDELFKKICDMSEEEFIKLAGENAWLRQSYGSNLGYPDAEFEVNDKNLVGWDSPIYSSKIGQKYETLSDYLCNCIGVSQPRNICACAMDLAKYNNMTMGELFENYKKKKNKFSKERINEKKCFQQNR